MSYVLGPKHRTIWRISSSFRGIKVLGRLGAVLNRLFLRNVNVALRCGETVRADLSHRDWDRIARRGFHELGADRFLCDFLMPADVVIDIGASCGPITLVAAKRILPGGTVYAFEPDPDNFRDLQAAIRRNRIRNVHLENQALGERSATVGFVRPQGAWGAFQLSEHPDGESEFASDERPATWETEFASQRTKRFTTQMVSLDEFVERCKIQVVHLVKIDVDGPEPSILKGMGRLLSSKCPPALLVETSRYNLEFGWSFEDMFGFLTSFGYRIFAGRRTSDHIIPILQASDLRTKLLEPHQATANLFCFVPSVHHDRASKLWFYSEAAAEG